jgi:hypothetical protein
MVYNFEISKNQIKLLMKYENITQRVFLLGNVVLTAFMSGREHDVISQHGDCSRESPVCVLACASVFRNKVRYQIVASLAELNMEKIHLQIMLSDAG